MAGAAVPMLEPHQANMVAGGLTLLVSAQLAVWVSADASGFERSSGLWAVLTFLFWPLIFPLYLFMTRGGQALISVAGVTAITMILGCGPLLSNSRKANENLKLTVDAEVMLADALKDGDGRRALIAQDMFEESIRGIHGVANFRGYGGLFEVAARLGNFGVADKSYEWLQKARVGILIERQRIEWHRSAITYHRHLGLARAEAAKKSGGGQDGWEAVIRHCEAAEELKILRERDFADKDISQLYPKNHLTIVVYQKELDALAHEAKRAFSPSPMTATPVGEEGQGQGDEQAGGQ